MPFKYELQALSKEPDNRRRIQSIDNLKAFFYNTPMNKNHSVRSWILISICFLILIASISYYLSNASSKNSTSQQITFTDVGFDTAITFEANCSKSDFDRYASIVSETFQYYNQLFDQYHSYDDINNVYTINHSAYSETVPIDSELQSLIQTAMDFNEINSNFDCTQGDLLDLWHSYREEGLTLNANGKDGELPSDTEIQDALQHGGNDKVILQDKTIQFSDPDSKIDLGGIAKGYATQKVKERLEEEGCSEGYINAGGNVVLIGNKDQEPWKIGVKDPDHESSLIEVTSQNPKAFVTSGDYQRYYIADNQVYSHIIDPDTGYPPEYHRSVTVICEDSTLADLLSTALFCMSLKDGKAFLSEYYPEVQAIWIDNISNDAEQPILQTKDYNIYATDNCKDQIDLIQ